MNTFNLAIVLSCLIVLVAAAPTETPAGQGSETTAPATEAPKPAETPATTVAPSSASQTTVVPSSTEGSAPQSAAAPAIDDTAKDANTTVPMTTTVNQESAINASAFTCYGRNIGYYADIDQECKVYHFCLLGEYNGEPVYQRISYLCLNGTIFDQQALDCVDEAKMTSPCKESATHYDSSNTILRQSIIGSKSQTNSTATSS